MLVPKKLVLGKSNMGSYICFYILSINLGKKKTNMGVPCVIIGKSKKENLYALNFMF